MINIFHFQEKVVPLTEKQKVMLVMSKEATKAERINDQYTLNERELQWLKGK